MTAHEQAVGSTPWVGPGEISLDLSAIIAFDAAAMIRPLPRVLVANVPQPCGRRREATCIPHPSGNSENMSSLLRKRRLTVSGTAIEPSSCMSSGCSHIPNLTIPNSKETTARRWDKDASRHREGVCRRLFAPQIVFGRHQCAYQTLRRAS